MPRNLEPMLATAAKALPGGDGWGFEVKWDGVRALAFVAADELRISARRGEDVASRYPELAPIAAAYAGRELILDGEVVAFDPEGNPSFGLLQRRMGLTNLARIRRRTAETPVTYVAFDLLWLDGRSLLAEPYERRRELLAELGFDGPAWQTPRHRLGDGEALLAAARERGLEGIVAKRLASPYRPGRRSADWIKVQNRRRQELVDRRLHDRRGRPLTPPRLAAGRLLGCDAGGGGEPRPSAAARLRRRRRHGLLAGDAGRAHRPARAAAARDEPVRGRVGSAGEVRGADSRARPDPVGRAGDRLRDRVPALDP